MIKIENTEVVGWEAAIRGMRNPHNSWSKSDSSVCAYSRHVPHCNDCVYVESCNPEEDIYKKYIVGPNDHDLMMRLAKGGSVHAKYRRTIVVYVDITAPLYWWKEFDTYKVGTVANSCSTMHKIHEKEFTLEDFSTDHLTPYSLIILKDTVKALNELRSFYLNWDSINDATRKVNEWADKKDIWWQMIQLLPSSYNQRRTVMLNYEVLAGMYYWRKDHKLDEWREFCQWIEQLPYSEIITARAEEKTEITGWRPISEYDRKNYDWVLVKCFDVGCECIPMIAELRSDGYWHTVEETIIPFENVRYFFDMKQLDGKESED